MGDLADAMLSGLFCQYCCVLVDGAEPGYPRICSGCAVGSDQNFDDGIDAPLQAMEVHKDKREPCPHCGKKKRNVSVHVRAKHPGESLTLEESSDAD